MGCMLIARAQYDKKVVEKWGKWGYFLNFLAYMYVYVRKGVLCF